MPNSRASRQSDISKFLQEEYDDGYKNGISEGLRVAQRILTWWSANHTLENPFSIETLNNWSNQDLDALKEKLSD